jgi:hypothetical protein
MFGTNVFLLVNFHILVTKNCGGVNDAKDFLLGKKKMGPNCHITREIILK